MRGKPNRYKNKILVALVALFTMLMCTSVGFATWITAGGSTANVNGAFEADNVVVGGETVDCITVSETSGPKYYSGSEASGFVNASGLYDKQNGTLSFVAVIDLTSARTIIDTLNSNGTFNFKIRLSTNTAISGLTAAMDTTTPLVLKSNYTTNVTSDIPTYGSPTNASLGTNELINISYPINNLTKTNHSQLTIKANMTFSFASDVFSTEIANFQSGTHKFIITLGAD